MSTYYDEVVVVVGRPGTDAAKLAFVRFHSRAREIFGAVDRSSVPEHDDSALVSEIMWSPERWHQRASFLVGACGMKASYSSTYAMTLFRGLVREIRQKESPGAHRTGDPDDDMNLTMALVDMGNDCNDDAPAVREFDDHALGFERPG